MHNIIHYFKKQLVDAAKSFRVGSAWEFENRMGPLIRPPEGPLKTAFTRLEPGEEWALKPEKINENDCLWTPGIKWGVRPGSYTHMTEFFGPVLGVMRAKNLDHAIQLASQTGYGLTSGLESLDQREQAYWKSRIKCGNLYVNRETTGAVVLRQPFGGMGKSALGAGIKAGGPNYVIQFLDVEDGDTPWRDATENDHPLMEMLRHWRQELSPEIWREYEVDIKKTVKAIKSYLLAYEQEFSREKDYFHLTGQDNILKYLPCGAMAVRLHAEDTLFEILARVAAVMISQCKLIISIPPGLRNIFTEFFLHQGGKQLTDNAEILYQSDTDLTRMMPHFGGIRYAAPDRVPTKVFEAAAKTGFYISRSKILQEGRVELLQYFREQSVCNTYHRYGNLGERATA